jgi:hypothetical protein
LGNNGYPVEMQILIVYIKCKTLQGKPEYQ